MAITQYSFKNLKEYLTNAQYTIPEYQRGYSWGKEQLEDIWGDLLHLYEDDELTEHFLGQVVVHNENKTKYIIDGQQRTSTSIIILDAFRKKFSKILENQEISNEYKKMAQKIIEEINVTYIPSGRGPRSKKRLTMGENDKNIFENYIQKDMDEKIEITKSRLKKSELLIYEASIFFYNKLTEFIETENNLSKSLDELVKLFDLFLDGLTVMYVETDRLNEAFIIFESLNARGKSLDTSDLLKNHLFRIGQHNLAIIKDNWSNMLSNLERVDVTSYIRVLWNARNTFVTKAKLYQIMRSKIDNAEKSLGLSRDLLEYSELYSALAHPEELIYFDNKELTKIIVNLANIGAKTYYPIVLALQINKVSENNILLVLKSIEVLLVRNVVVGGASSNSLEKEFARIAYSITHNKTNIENIIKEIQQLTKSDKEFVYDFSNFIVKSPKTIRYLFRKIENFNENEIKVNENNNKVHIEHIMPQKPKDWGVVKEDHAAYVNRFGNLTLLGGEYNRSATNSTFDRKKEIYKNSKIKITYNISKKDKWNIKDIEDRQTELAKIAKDVWPK